MNTINVNDSQEIKISNPEHIPGAITVLSEGKRFESYIRWSFSKELKCEKYVLGVKYSLSKEKKKIKRNCGSFL